MWVAFALQKLLTFLINVIVSFEQLGPGFNPYYPIPAIKQFYCWLVQGRISIAVLLCFASYCLLEFCSRVSFFFIIY